MLGAWYPEVFPSGTGKLRAKRFVRDLPRDYEDVDLDAMQRAMKRAEYNELKEGSLEIEVRQQLDEIMTDYEAGLRRVQAEMKQARVELEYARFAKLFPRVMVIDYAFHQTLRHGIREISTSCLIVGGNGKGTAGFGRGKAKDMDDAYELAWKDMRRHLLHVPLIHDGGLSKTVMGEHNGTKVMIKANPIGGYLLAGDLVFSVLDMFGIKYATAKILGRRRRNYNVIYAIFDALSKVSSVREMAMEMGVNIWRWTEPGNKHKPIRPSARELEQQGHRINDIIAQIDEIKQMRKSLTRITQLLDDASDPEEQKRARLALAAAEDRAVKFRESGDHPAADALSHEDEQALDKEQAILSRLLELKAQHLEAKRGALKAGQPAPRPSAEHAEEEAKLQKELAVSMKGRDLRAKARMSKRPAKGQDADSGSVVAAAAMSDRDSLSTAEQAEEEALQGQPLSQEQKDGRLEFNRQQRAKLARMLLDMYNDQKAQEVEIAREEAEIEAMANQLMGLAGAGGSAPEASGDADREPTLDDLSEEDRKLLEEAEKEDNAAAGAGPGTGTEAAASEEAGDGAEDAEDDDAAADDAEEAEEGRDDGDYDPKKDEWLKENWEPLTDEQKRAKADAEYKENPEDAPFDEAIHNSPMYAVESWMNWMARKYADLYGSEETRDKTFPPASQQYFLNHAAPADRAPWEPDAGNIRTQMRKLVNGPWLSRQERVARAVGQSFVLEPQMQQFPEPPQPRSVAPPTRSRQMVPEGRTVPALTPRGSYEWTAPTWTHRQQSRQYKRAHFFEYKNRRSW